MKNKKTLLTISLFFTFFSGTPSSCCRPIEIAGEKGPVEVFQTKLEELKGKIKLFDQYEKDH